MPDKPQAAASPSVARPEHRFALHEHAIVALSGRDALAFAQAQCMNDLAALAPGDWQWNGWLTPKGRTIALFALLKLDEQTLWLLLPDASAADFAEQLRRFVFRTKVTIAVRDDLRASGAFAASTLASGAHFVADAHGGVELDMSGDGGGRNLRIDAVDAAVDARALAQWSAADLRHGLPRLLPEQSGLWTPQQLSLDRLRAYSVKKGCYPGQEIVARTHFLGQAKRGLALFEAAAPVAAGSELHDADGAIGTAISTAPSAQGVLVLAVVTLDRQSPTAMSAGIELRRSPLLDGLAR